MWATQIQSLMTRRPEPHSRNMVFGDEVPAEKKQRKGPSTQAHEAALKRKRELRAERENTILRVIKQLGKACRQDLITHGRFNGPDYVGQIANRMVEDGRLKATMIKRVQYWEAA